MYLMKRIFELLDEQPETDEGYVTLVNARLVNDELVETPERTGLWAAADAPAGRFQAEQPTFARRDADRSTTVGCMRDRHHPCGDGRRGATR